MPVAFHFSEPCLKLAYLSFQFFGFGIIHCELSYEFLFCHLCHCLFTGAANQPLVHDHDFRPYLHFDCGGEPRGTRWA